jgi:hypothetical protein
MIRVFGFIERLAGKQQARRSRRACDRQPSQRDFL